MTALGATLVAIFVIGVPFYTLGLIVGRRLERRDGRRRIARAHRPPRAPARDVIRNARLVANGGPDHPVLALVGKPAFGDEPAGQWDCFGDEPA